MKHILKFITIVTFSMSGFVFAEGALVVSHKDKTLQWGPCPEFIPAGCQIAVLQGNPAENNLDVFFKVPSDFELPLHIHTSQ